MDTLLFFSFSRSGILLSCICLQYMVYNGDVKEDVIDLIPWFVAGINALTVCSWISMYAAAALLLHLLTFY